MRSDYYADTTSTRLQTINSENGLEKTTSDKDFGLNSENSVEKSKPDLDVLTGVS